MLYVSYDPYVNEYAVADAHALEDVIAAIAAYKQDYAPENRDMIIQTSNDIVIQSFRLAIMRALISPEHITFRYIKHHPDGMTESVRIEHDAHGQFREWYEGFCDWGDKLIDEMLDLRGELRALRDRLQQQPEHIIAEMERREQNDGI